MRKKTMSKKTDNEQQEAIQPKQEEQQPAYVGELLLNGTAILKAKTREELMEMVNNIPHDCKFSAGAFGRSKEDGTFSLQVDIIKM